MITQFKIFEKLDNKKRFWLINISDETYFLASLNHINCTENEIHNFIGIAISMKIHEDKVYINKATKDDMDGYIDYDEGFDWYSKNGYIFMGEIIPTEEEIETVKIQKNAQKYNI